MSGFAPDVGRHRPEARIGMGFVKLLAAAALALASYCGVTYLTSDFVEALGGTAPAMPAGKPHRIPGTVENFEKATVGMKESSDLLVNWAIVLFGGTIGIAILAQGPKIRDESWSLILIPPTWVLLYASILHGSRFRDSLNFQLARGEYVFRDLNLELFLQREFLRYSLVALVALAVVYLFFRFALLEDRGSKGD